MKSLFLFLSINILSNLAVAQNYNFKKLTELNGLSDNRVTCFQKDRTGYMWIGTENGLNRYDGFTFQIYRPGQKSNKISHEHITDIEEDVQGRLWVATWNGLNIINPVDDSLYVFLPDDEDGAGQKKTRIANSLVWDIHIDKKSNIWLALDTRDLCYYNPIQKEFTYFPWLEFAKTVLPQHASDYKSIHKIIRKSENELWLGTTLGLFSFNIKTKVFLYHGGDSPEDFVSMHYDSVRQCVYFGQKKLYMYNVIQHTIRELKSNISSIPPNLKSSSTILIPTINGLWLVNKITEQTQLLSLDKKNTFRLQHEKVSTTFQNNRNTWVGTSSGIFLYDYHLDVFPFIRVFPDTVQMVAGNVFYVLDHEESNTYYISSYSRNSLIKMNKKTRVCEEIKTIDRKPLQFCTKIIIDSKHRIWLLSAEYIFVSNEDQKCFSVFPFPKVSDNYRFSDMIEDADGNFWFASLRNGVYKYITKSNAWTLIPTDPNALFADRVTALLSDPTHHAVWIGDFSFGLFRYDLKTKTYTYYKANTNIQGSIQSSLINALSIDNKGDVWVATTSGGVSKYSQDSKKFTTYSMETGLPENTIYSIQPDLHGYIWLASNKGITQMKTNGEIIRHHDGNNGLPYSYFSTPFSTNLNNEILIGTENGFIKFHPDSIKNNTSDFPIVITSAKQGVRLLNTTLKHTFSYTENEFNFQFAGLTYSLPDQIVYFYKLEGYDKDWVNAENNHTARYTNLNNGKYTFSVKALDYSGRPSLQPAQFSFTITPPFWKEGWFIFFMVVVLSITFYLWIRSMQRKIQSQKILNQLATSLYGQNSVDRVFQTVVNTCGESFLFENTIIYLVNQEKCVLIPNSTSRSGAKNNHLPDNPIEIIPGKGIVGEVAQTGNALIGNSSSKNKSNTTENLKLSEIASPVLIEGKVFAVIASTHETKNHYSRWHLNVLKEIAAICSVKIERYFAEEQIRSKVARDLHDDIGSTLSSINILSQVALVEKNGNTQTYLQRIGEQTTRMMEDMGDMVWSINPRNDSMSQIIIRMREFASEIFELKNMEYSFSDKVSESLILDADKRKNLFLIFKETINNAAKYSLVALRNCSRVVSSGSASTTTPALLTNMSSRPNFASVAAIVSFHEASDATSWATAIALDPISAATAWAAARLMSLTTTEAPSAARSRQSALPNPEPPPVTKATLPATLPIARHSVYRLRWSRRWNWLPVKAKTIMIVFNIEGFNPDGAYRDQHSKTRPGA